MDQFKQEQEAIALRQLVEQTYANNPQVLEALRTNADALDLELRSLPAGSSPSVAIDHLKSQQWFREAESAPSPHFSTGVSWETESAQSWQSEPEASTPPSSHQPTYGLIPWLHDNELVRLAKQGLADGAMWAQRYDPTCPSEFYRGYATLLVRIGAAFRSNANLSALKRLIETFDIEVQALPADERRNGASFALTNVASYAQVGTVRQISATLDIETRCIAHCFVQNLARGL